MARHTSRRRRPRRREKREFEAKIPVTWTQVKSAAQESQRQLHAISWRTRLQDIGQQLFESPRWISLLILFVLGGGIYLLGITPDYVVQEVAVSGLVALSREAVVEASGLEGAHIFWADPAGAAAKIAEIPSVLTATVELDWPNSAAITVNERAPVMAWDQAGDRFWVDQNGRLMQARQETGALLVILSQVSDKLEFGETVPLDAMAGALQLKALRPNIDTLFYERGNGLSYHDGRNWDAFFGVGTDMNQKLVVYETLVGDLMARNLQPEYISVVNTLKPFYRLADSAE
jgi:cell division septal protein FtsQ